MEDVRLALVSEASFILLIALVVIKIRMVVYWCYWSIFPADLYSPPFVTAQHDISQRRMEVVRNRDCGEALLLLRLHVRADGQRVAIWNPYSR